MGARVQWLGQDERTDLARIEHAPAVDVLPRHDLQYSPNPFCRRIAVVVWILGHCQRRRRTSVPTRTRWADIHTHRVSPRALYARRDVLGQDRIYVGMGAKRQQDPTTGYGSTYAWTSQNVPPLSAQILTDRSGTTMAEGTRGCHGRSARGGAGVISAAPVTSLVPSARLN